MHTAKAGGYYQFKTGGEVMEMDEIKINKIGNGYTIYVDCSTYFVKTEDELMDCVKRAMELLETK